MTFPFAIPDIAKATGCPVKAIQANWPLIAAAAQKHGIGDIPSTVGMLATLAVECRFVPIKEFGTSNYFIENYWTNVDTRNALGNLSAQDAIAFRGAGYVQLTGRSNYLKYGQKIGVDLIAHPEKALLPEYAAPIFVEFYKDHGCPVWAARANWRRVRKQINGGYNHLNDFLAAVWNLLDIAY